jgi:hypothetical protein
MTRTFVSTALILNADRDFYQAVAAEKDLLAGRLTADETEALKGISMKTRSRSGTG